MVRIKIGDRIVNLNQAIKEGGRNRHAEKHLAEHPLFVALLRQDGEFQALWGQYDQAIRTLQRLNV